MDDDLPPEFYDCVDRIIGVANELVPEHGVSRVSAIMMFAAARFNAHCARALDPDADENRDRIVEYFTDQYAKMFRDNFARLRAIPD